MESLNGPDAFHKPMRNTHDSVFRAHRVEGDNMPTINDSHYVQYHCESSHRAV